MNVKLPHRRFQVKAPQQREALGTLMGKIKEYDDKNVTKNAFTQDTIHWRGHHFIKTNKDLELVKKLYQKHFIMLKDIFVYKVS